jgi:AraC-like DNA-binding protein
MPDNRAGDKGEGRLGGVAMNAHDDFAVTNFSTAELPESERIAMLHEHYARTVLKVEIEPAEAKRFKARIVSRRLLDLQMLSGTLSAARVTRTRAFVADGNDDLGLVVNWTGHVAVSARGREVVLGEGDGVLISSEDVTSCQRAGAGRSFSLRIPRAVLTSLVVDADDSVMRLISHKSQALRLLTGYAGMLMNGNVPAEPALQRLAAGHLHELMSLTLSPTLDAADMARGRGIQAARLREAKIYIISNCCRQDISVSAVAEHLGVTRRYLQRLFEGDGNTFSAFLLDERLKLAHRMLSEVRFVDRAIGSIAYDVGFGDLSYFNRCFRKLYGITPSGVRNGDAG